MEINGIEGSNLDARLKQCMMNDPVLQVDLSGDEFRAFINLTVWAVSLVSGGEFERKYALMVHGMTPAMFQRLVDVRVVEPYCDRFRINPMYWKWQSTTKELEQIAARRAQARLRQADRRESLRSVK